MKLYSLSIDLYIIDEGIVYINLFGNWNKSSLFKNESELLKSGAKEVTNAVYIINNFKHRMK